MTQIILLNIVPLKTSWAQNVQTSHQGDLAKTRHVQQIKSTQADDSGEKIQGSTFYWILTPSGSLAMA